MVSKGEMAPVVLIQHITADSPCNCRMWLLCRAIEPVETEAFAELCKGTSEPTARVRLLWDVVGRTHEVSDHSFMVWEVARTVSYGLGQARRERSFWYEV